MDVSRVVSALIVTVCVLMLCRLVLPAASRARLDHRLRRLPESMRGHWRVIRHGRRPRVDAEKLARDAIERARKNQVERDGNVIKPDAFKGPRKPH